MKRNTFVSMGFSAMTCRPINRRNTSPCIDWDLQPDWLLAGDTPLNVPRWTVTIGYGARRRICTNIHTYSISRGNPVCHD
ncbi:hypothetical protein XENTR_v10017590 [Xenopus tropicalis]|nr:hypothetical protein XENTR_v10017590 [Xenopus tropicalis]